MTRALGKERAIKRACRQHQTKIETARGQANRVWLHHF
jgi:hypothetical protein